MEEVDLLDRRGYLVISITLSSRGEGKIYLRKTEGIRDWFNSLKVSTDNVRRIHLAFQLNGRMIGRKLAQNDNLMHARK